MNNYNPKSNTQVGKNSTTTAPSGNSPKVDNSKNINSGITLSDFALKLQVPQASLQALGIYERKKDGKPAIYIPYLDSDLNQVAVCIRKKWQGPFATTWKSNSKSIPYGIWQGKVLHSCTQNKEKEKIIFLVHGEHNAIILWHLGYSALGIPGNLIWKEEWNDYLADYPEIYYWVEPKQNIFELAEKINLVLPSAKLIFSPEDIFPILIGPNDIALELERLILSAESAIQILDRQKNKLADLASIEAGDLLNETNILDVFYKSCVEQGLIGEERNVKLIYLSLTSRLLERQVNLAIKGQSSGGKSFTLVTVMRYFPDSAFYALSSMSDRALIYWDEPMMHRYLVIYEAAGIYSEIQNYLIRSLLSEGCIRYVTVESTIEGLKPREIEKHGPTGLILTTTAISLHPENETRMFSLSIEDDPEQTKQIFHALADRVNGTEPKQTDFNRWHALQTWLELAGHREVAIPFAHQLADLSCNTEVRLRRDFGALLILIKTHAMLHQRNREIDGAGRIIATLEDYRVIYHLVVDVISEGIESSVDPKLKETVDAVSRIVTRNQNKYATYKNLCDELNIGTSTISRRVNRAIKLGYLLNLAIKENSLAKIILGTPLPNDTQVIPHPDELEKNIVSPPPDFCATSQHPFIPSADWQEVPDRVAVPPNGEYRMVLGGKCYARWPELGPEKAPVQSTAPETEIEKDDPQTGHLNSTDMSSQYQDTSKPCYACGGMNWKERPQTSGGGWYCGVCHPNKNK